MTPMTGASSDLSGGWKVNAYCIATSPNLYAFAKYIIDAARALARHGIQLWHYDWPRWLMTNSDLSSADLEPRPTIRWTSSWRRAYGAAAGGLDFGLRASQQVSLQVLDGLAYS